MHCNHCATAVHRIAARCPLPVRFSSMLLYVVVVHVARLYVVVIVYEYRLSSHYRRVRAAHGGGCASHSTRMTCGDHIVWISGASFAPRARAEVTGGCAMRT